MSEIVEAVAKAVYERLKLGRLAGRVGLGSFAWEIQAPDDQEIVREAARAAIEAYEAVKREEITVAFPAEMTEELRADVDFSRGEQWPQDLSPESANVEPAEHDIVRISGGYIGFKP